jgi:hypothetical protein
MLLELGATPGKCFLVRTENTTTYSVMYQRKSRDHWVNKEWKSIQCTLLDSEVDVHLLWIALGENNADTLSRGERDGCREQDNLAITLPLDLAPFLYQHRI